MRSFIVALVVAVSGVALAVIPSETSRIIATGNGITVAFTFTFPVTTSATHVKVYVSDVLQTSGYSVTLNPNQAVSPGGTVTFVTAPVNGSTVRIERTVPLTQETVYTPYSAFPAKTTEKALDRIVMQQQQLNRGMVDATAIATEARASAASSAAAASAAASSAAASASSAALVAAGVAQGSVGGNDTLVTAAGATSPRRLADHLGNPFAPTYTSTIGSGNAFVANGGTKWCFDGQSCAAYLRFSGGVFEASAPVPAAPGWYVDSVNGNDANDALGPSTAAKTIAALLAKPIARRDTIWLARGSYWREQMYGLPAGARVISYGSGPRPVFDAADVVTTSAWTKTDGRTNVYQTAVTVDSAPYFSTGKLRHRVWVNGAPLHWVADPATCDSTAGSWSGPKTATAGPDTIYVHPLGDTDPRVDGKTYEVARRSWGLNCGQYKSSAGCVEVAGVYARRQLHDDGALLSAGIVRDSIADDGSDLTGAVVANPDGPSHALWNNGYAEDVTSYGSNPFITYGEPLGATFKRATAYPVANGIGFFFHWGPGAALKKMICDECKTYGGGSAGSNAHIAGGDYTDLVILNNEAYRVAKIFEGVGTGTSSTHVLGGRFVLTYGAGNRGISILAGNASHSLVARGARFVANEATGGGMVYDVSGGTTDVQRCTFAWIDNSVYAGWRTAVNGSGPTTFSYNVLHNTGGNAVAAGGYPLTADYNLLSQDAGIWYSNATPYANLAAHQAAGQNLHSTVAAQTFVGSLWSGDTRVADPSWANTTTVGADYSGAALDVIGQYARDSVRSAP